MGDGVQRTYALIVNGDPDEERHFQNVDQAVKALKAEDPDYHIAVASSRKPSAPVAVYLPPNAKNLKTLIAGLREKTDDDDLFLVYVTGHGGPGDNKEGCADLPDGCFSNTQLAQELKTIHYGKRIVIMDDCYSGGAIPLFNDGKSLLITAGSPGEVVSCHQFSPYLWDEKVPDSDGDGVVTLAERYRHALKTGETLTFSNYFSPMGSLSFSGVEAKKPAFESKVLTVHSGKELKKALGKLQPDQLAMVMFSADWCVYCPEYWVKFQKLSQEYGGQYLMIRAEGINDSEEDWAEWGIHAYPTVAFIDSRGGQLTVMREYRDRPREYLLEFPVLNLTLEERIQHIGKMVKGTPFMKRLDRLIRDPRPYPEALLDLKLHLFPTPTDKSLYLVPYLTKLLKHGPPAHRARAAAALGQFRGDSQSALGELKLLFKDPNPGVRLEAIKAILLIDPPLYTYSEIKMGDSATSAVSVSGRSYQFDELDKEIERLRHVPNPDIRFQATEAKKLTLDRNHKDYTWNEISLDLGLLDDPDSENRWKGLMGAVMKLDLVEVTGKFLEEKKRRQIIKRVVPYVRKDTYLASGLAWLLEQASTAKGTSFTKLLVQILDESENSSLEVTLHLGHALRKAHRNNKDSIRRLYSKLDNRAKRGNYFGFSITPVKSLETSKGYQIGSQLSHAYRWNRIIEWRTLAGFNWVGNQSPDEPEYRFEAMTGPAFHWPKPLVHNRFDPYLATQVGLFHLFEEDATGFSLAPGIGLQFRLTNYLLLDATAQLMVDFPSSGSPSLGARVPIGLTFRFR